MLVLVATLVPAQPESPKDWQTVLCVLCGRAAVADGLANIALFLPLGVTLALAGWPRKRGVPLAAGLSLCVEIAQFAIPGRDPSVSDVIFDTLGAGLGLGFARVAPRWSRPGIRAASRLSLLAAFGAGGVFVLTAVLLTVALPETAYFGGSASIQTTDRPLRIGGNLEPKGHFQGRIDEVRIYRRARTPSEIQEDMRSPLTAAPPRSADLVAAYSFDEGTGTEVADLSGHGHRGRLQGATWTTQGRFSGALTFDGVGSVVVIPHSPALDLADAMTLEAWIYPTAAQTGWRAVLQKDFDAYFLLAGSRAGPRRPGGGATFGTSTEVMTTPAVVPIDRWTHVALTYDAAVLRLYIDGLPVIRRPRWYPGRVIGITVDGRALPSGLVTDWARVRERLVAGASLRVEAVAASSVPAEVPLVTLHDASRNEILLLAAEGEDVVFRLRTWAAAMGLDAPPLRAAGAMAGLRSGHPFSVSVTRPDRRYCVAVDARVECGLGVTAGMGWGLLAYSQIHGPSTRQMLNLLWMATLVLPFGFWFRRRPESLAGLLLLVASLLLPRAFGSLNVEPLELSAAALGGVLGAVVGRWHAGLARNSARMQRS